jgi:hypothetical protein
MKNRLLYFLTALIFLLPASGSLFAQSQEQIEKFNEERKAYFTENLELTDAESKAFWPLYEDFQNRKMKLVEDEMNTYKYANKNIDNLTDSEIKTTLEKIYRLKEEQLQLETEYYQVKFHKALPAKKVLKLGKVEWDFRHHLIRKLRGEETSQRGNGGGSGRPEGMEPTSLGPFPEQGPSPTYQ